MSRELPENNTGAEQKINEYVNRIRAGESKESIFQGLPDSFKGGIEKKLNTPPDEVKKDRVDIIPPQYKGMNSEALDFIWTIPEYVDPEKTKELKEQKAAAIALLREKEASALESEQKERDRQNRVNELRKEFGIAQPVEVAHDLHKEISNQSVEQIPLVDIKGREKLNGWPASYELAKIAKQQGLDLSKISREDYADFAIQNSLAIDDDQLRMSPWQRTATSVQEIVLGNKELKSKIDKEAESSFAKFSHDMQEKAAESDRFLQDGVRVRQGTKDSNSWLFFGINGGTVEHQNETYKSYISVKDLNTLSPEKFKQFMGALKEAKYNGDIKIFQDLSEQGIRLNDQIVMHGASESDAKLALQVAEQFFGKELDQKSIGKDEIVDGVNKSYSQILAKKISDLVKSKRIGG